MEALIPIIIQAVSGMVGGGVIGGMVKKAAMGMLPKLLAGGLGGIGGASILGSIMGSGADPAMAMDMMSSGSLINNIGGGLVGGGVLSGIAGMVMGAMKK